MNTLTPFKPLPIGEYFSRSSVPGTPSQESAEITRMNAARPVYDAELGIGPKSEIETHEPPTGYAIIQSGPIAAGDRAWDAKTASWVKCPDLLNYPAEDYVAICRKTEPES